jgi:hypothetical protein
MTHLWGVLCCSAVVTSAAPVDRLGCERKQIDIDFDGHCDVTRPRDASGNVLPTRHCSGIDNCKHVRNVLQIDSDGDGKGNGCDVGA